MFLILIGADRSIMIILILTVLACGLLIYWMSKKLLRRVLTGTSDLKIKAFSMISAFILSPPIVLGFLALFIYLTIQDPRRQSPEEIAKDQYQMMEEDFKDDLKIGMSKTQVTQLFGEVDTTGSVLIYDMSLRGAKEQYILELTFDNKGLKDFKRQP